MRWTNKCPLPEGGAGREGGGEAPQRRRVDEMDEESDIDILIEFEGRRSLLDLAHLKNELEDATNRRVDVLTYKSLHPRLKDRILAEQVPIL
ncbi:MAG: nucleotidyltransferase domain-containing protein [Methanothrix harundinacea]|nr:nucleotidyltransferase domain-containing protein [Methanothrix harundinacea]